MISLKVKKESFQNISKFTSQLSYTNFDIELNKVEESQAQRKEEMQKDSQIYKEISNKIQKQIENIEKDLDKLYAYQNVISSLLDVFERRNQLELEILRNENDDFMNIKAEEMNNQMDSFNEQFQDELTNFNEYLEQNLYLTEEKNKTIELSKDKLTKINEEQEKSYAALLTKANLLTKKISNINSFVESKCKDKTFIENFFKFFIDDEIN